MSWFHSVWTSVALAAFIAIVVWAYSRKRHESFSEAARLPLDDEDRPSDSDPEGKDHG
jgi:cytochrome c oxidase cbb3-type subunit 4